MIRNAVFERRGEQRGFMRHKQKTRLPCSSDRLQPSSASSELPHKPGEKNSQNRGLFSRCCRSSLKKNANSILSHLFVRPLRYVTGLVFVFQLHSLSKRISLFNVLLSLSLFLLPLFLLLLLLFGRLVALINSEVGKENASNRSFCTRSRLFSLLTIQV